MFEPPNNRPLFFEDNREFPDPGLTALEYWEILCERYGFQELSINVNEHWNVEFFVEVPIEENRQSVEDWIREQMTLIEQEGYLTVKSVSYGYDKDDATRYPFPPTAIVKFVVSETLAAVYHSPKTLFSNN